MLSGVFHQLQSATLPPTTGDWRKHSLKPYRKLWSQLSLHNVAICCQGHSPTMQEARLLVVVPKSRQKAFLETAHNESGHPGIDRTLARLSEVAYWVGQGQDVVCHCQCCTRCQLTRSMVNKPPPCYQSLRENHGRWLRSHIHP